MNEAKTREWQQWLRARADESVRRRAGRTSAPAGGVAAAGTRQAVI